MMASEREAGATQDPGCQGTVKRKNAGAHMYDVL